MRKLLLPLCAATAVLVTITIVQSLALRASDESPSLVLRESPGLQPTAAGGKTDLVFIGTYTSKNGSKGIYRAEIDPASGKLSKAVLAIESSNPSFLAIHPSGKMLYAVNEDSTFEGMKQGAVSAFSLDKETGALKLLAQKGSGGPAPCNIMVNPSGKQVAVANYNGGGGETGDLTDNIRVFRLTETGEFDGDKFITKMTTLRYRAGLRQGADKVRQLASHPHCVMFTPDGNQLLLADLGVDRVFVRDSKEIGLGRWLDLATGAGPRHLDLDAKGKLVYVVNELNSTVTVFELETSKQLQTIATLPKDADAKKNFPAEIRVHKELGYVYASNRGHDSIAIFKINKEDGTLTAVGHTQHPQIKTPRGFTLYKNFLIAAGQSSNRIVVFRIDPATGSLTALDETIEVGAPVCLRVLQRG